MKTIDKEIEIKMHRFNQVENIIISNDSLVNFGIFIEDLELDKRKHYLSKSTKADILINAKTFFMRHFKLHKIPYKGKIRSDSDKYILKYIPGINIPLKLYNICREIDPFKLPVDFISENPFDCMLVENATHIKTNKFLENMQISYQKIILPKDINELTESSYIHELTHTQLSHQKGIIKNYYNSEVLSIFLEILNIYESSEQETLLPLQDAIRLTELHQEIYNLEAYRQGISEESFDSLIETSKYTESILKAYNLFVEYYYGTNQQKKEILDSIQNIFNGHNQLEDLLDKMDISLQSSLDNPKLIKYLKR